MVNEEPGDYGRAVKYEDVNMEEEEAEQEVMEQGDDDLLSDSDEDQSDSDSDDFSSDEENSDNEEQDDEGIVRSDQEDSEDEEEEEEEEGEENGNRPHQEARFQEYILEMMPDVTDVNIVLAYEKCIRDLINKEPSALLNGHGINNLADYEEVKDHLEREEKLADYAWRQTCLWPYVREAVRLYQSSDLLEGMNEIEHTVVPPVVTEALENAITTLLDGLERPRPHQTWEGYQEAIEYEDKRTNLHLDVAKTYHGLKNSRPGEEHMFGQVMPAHFSYDMIEYLMCALGTTGYNIREELDKNTVAYPEVDELEEPGRRLIEMVFVMDPEYRDEFISLVEELCRQANIMLTDVEKHFVATIFDEMNSVFSGQFENFIIYEADKKRRDEEINESRHTDPRRYFELLDEAEDAERNMLNYIHNIEE